MRVAIIGRTEILLDTAQLLCELGHEIAVVVTSKEAAEYTKTSLDFKKFADKLHIPFIHTPKILDAVQLIKDQKAIDIGVSFNFSGVIPKTVIDLFPLGILNAHGGDLPRYRGNACQAWAILNGEDRVGLCVHSMIGGELDSGDIIAREYYPIFQETKITDIHAWMSHRVPHLFIQAIQSLESNNSFFIERQSKNPLDALRCYPRRPSDGRIDWLQDNLKVLRLINACNKPYAGAFCEFEDRPLIIWDAELAPSENFLAIPGQITATTDSYVDVACGDGKLRVKQIEYLGQTVLPGTLLRSIRARLS